jgi:hypothetical protein
LPGTVLSDSGRLAYTAWFADGTNAVFVADLGAARITDSFTVSAGESFDVPGPLRIESGSDLTVSDGGSITTPDLVIEAGSRVQLGSGAAVVADRVTNNGVFAGPLSVSGSQVYGGAGVLEGFLEVSDGGTQAPGNSPGIQTMETLQWGGGGVLELEISDAGGVAGAGWDLITVADAMEITADAVLEAGRNGGGWDGERGIVSATAAAESADGLVRGVGWKENPDGSITVAYAAPGDVNLDGEVDIFDMVDVTSSGAYGVGTASVWSQGDFDYNGVTNIFDLVLVSGAGMYGAGNYLPEPALALNAAAVPEPSLEMLVLAAAGWLARRGRRPPIPAGG